MNRYLGPERLSRTLLTLDGGVGGDHLSPTDAIDEAPHENAVECSDVDAPDRRFIDLATLLMTSAVGVATEEG